MKKRAGPVAPQAPDALRLASWVCRASAEGTQAEVTQKAAGRMSYRPASFAELIGDAVASIEAALKDGITRLEVDFPAVPGGSNGARLAG